MWLLLQLVTKRAMVVSDATLNLRAIRSHPGWVVEPESQTVSLSLRTLKIAADKLEAACVSRAFARSRIALAAEPPSRLRKFGELLGEPLALSGKPKRSRLEVLETFDVPRWPRRELARRAH